MTGLPQYNGAKVFERSISSNGSAIVVIVGKIPADGADERKNDRAKRNEKASLSIGPL